MASQPPKPYGRGLWIPNLHEQEPSNRILDLHSGRLKKKKQATKIFDTTQFSFLVHLPGTIFFNVYYKN